MPPTEPPNADPDRCSKARCSRSTHRALPFPDAATTPWQQTLQSILNAANARATPRQCRAGARDRRSTAAGCAAARRSARRRRATWLDELNLDPRERVVAALGTRVIQEQQEELMAEAWEQAGEMAQVNQRLRQMQLSLAITSRLHARHVARIDDDDTLWRFASPAQSRLVHARGHGGHGAQMTMRAMLASSSTPQVVTSAAMRRLVAARAARSAAARRPRCASRACRPLRLRDDGTGDRRRCSALYGHAAMGDDLHAAADARAGELRCRDAPAAAAACRHDLLRARPTRRSQSMPPRPAFVVTAEPSRRAPASCWRARS